MLITRIFASSFIIGMLSSVPCGVTHTNSSTSYGSKPLQHMRVPSRANVITRTPTTCPSEMVLVEGDYCKDLVQTCIKERPVDPHVKNANHTPAVCEEFSKQMTCVGGTKHLRFCIDRYEHTEPGSKLPQVYVSWVQAKEICESEGKRLPKSDEWTKAAEGPANNPLAYGTGFLRDKKICAIDKLWRDPWANSFEKIDQREPVDARPGCVSDYGVVNMNGNVDEWVVNESGTLHGEPYISGLMGGHMLGVRNTARAITTSHEPGFSWYVQGFRCAKSL